MQIARMIQRVSVSKFFLYPKLCLGREIKIWMLHEEVSNMWFIFIILFVVFIPV
jgi:hypothetical protein